MPRVELFGCVGIGIVVSKAWKHYIMHKKFFLVMGEELVSNTYTGISCYCSICKYDLHVFLCRSAYILKPDSLPSSYKSFLNKHGGKDLTILQGLKDIVNHTAISNLAGIEKYYKSVGVDIKLDPNMKVPCPVSIRYVFYRSRLLSLASNP
jgi:hypothetical protein